MLPPMLRSASRHLRHDETTWMTAPGTGNVAPDAVAPPPGHRRFLFDGLRAIAVILIVVFTPASSTSAGSLSCECLSTSTSA